MEATKLPLTKWFQAFYLVGDAKTGISSLSLMRKLGVNYRTAWLLHSSFEVGAFYWTDMAPDIVNPGREEQGSVSV